MCSLQVVTERKYQPRLVDDLLSDLIQSFPAFFLAGPRAAGKTTTASRHVRSIAKLDERESATIFRSDPDAALQSMDEPLLIDEWQEVPEVLGAIKRAVDADPRPGRFILTGSVRAYSDGSLWPGTGRLITLPMYGLTERELKGSLRGPLQGSMFLESISEADAQAVNLPKDKPDLVGYLELSLRSGFPEAVILAKEGQRQRWLVAYMNQLLTKDAGALEPRRDLDRLGRYFLAIAHNTANVPSNRTLYEAADVGQKTAIAYEHLLNDLMVIDRVPAWSTNKLSGLVKSSKCYMVEPALAAVALGLDIKGVLRRGTLIGQLIDTYVMAQLRAEVALQPIPPRIYHLRSEKGRHEVDIVVEKGAGEIIGIEVKAKTGPDKSDARHLMWLRDSLGEKFIAGVVMHTGSRCYQLDEKIMAVPICAMWA